MGVFIAIMIILFFVLALILMLAFLIMLLPLAFEAIDDIKHTVKEWKNERNNRN